MRRYLPVRFTLENVTRFFAGERLRSLTTPFTALTRKFTLLSPQLSLWVFGTTLLSLSTMALANEDNAAPDDTNVQIIEVDNVSVTWGDYREFTDIRSPNSSKKRFAKHTFERLTKYIAKLASDLPEGQNLQLSVTNLDLAGRVLPLSFAGLGNNMSEQRIIKRIDIPRMSFSYTLVDASGATLKQGEANLKDMNFMERHNPFFRSEALKYEKNMLRQWFTELENS
jgi:hypothetical protein